MKIAHIVKCLTVFISSLLLVDGCAGNATLSKPPAAYLAHMPQSILVLPPQNESTDVNAPYINLSTVTSPIAEKGFYVYPVAVIDQFMKANGVPTPEDMARVPLKKIDEIIHPDAVMYITIKEWGTKYRVLDSSTIVACQARLIDTDTGTMLWEGRHRTVKSSGQGSNSIAELLISAVVNQIVTSIADPSRDVSRINNLSLFMNKHTGLPYGKRHHLYEAEQEKWRNAMDKQ